jgi:hypothetical protein
MILERSNLSGTSFNGKTMYHNVSCPNFINILEKNGHVAFCTSSISRKGKKSTSFGKVTITFT